MGDLVQVMATVVLVVITAYYAWQTKAMVKEMVTARREQEAVRLRERSDAAARQTLGVLTLRDDEANVHGAQWLTGERCRELWLEVRRESWGIQDDQVRDRAEACGKAALSLLKDAHAFSDGDRNVAVLHLHNMITCARQTLEEHLARRPLPPWDDLPQANRAQAWILNKAKGL